MDDLYTHICNFETLFQSFWRARAGKRKQTAVANFERNLEPELFQLQDELLGQIYQPGPYRSFYLTDSKRRLISAAPFRDRVVHHALVDTIEPLFERRFIFDTYANRQGKGTHRALDRCTQFLRASHYSLQGDIRQFFPSIDHAILQTQLARVIHDTRALGLADTIMATGAGVLDEEYEMVYFSGDNLFAQNRPRGLPIGNLTSQFWANVYLNPFDHFVKRELKCRRYLRYVDDFVLFADDKQTLHDWKKRIIEYLFEIRLTIHERAAQVRPVSEGLPFLGFIVYPDHRRLKPRRGYSFRRRLWSWLTQYAAGLMSADRISASIRGWVGHVAHGDTWGLRRAMLRGVSV